MTGRGGPAGAGGPGGRLAALEPGTPVTVRHRVPDIARAAPDEGGRPLLADVVATVVAVGAERVRLRRADGTAVSVRLDRVTAVRVLPGPPGPGRPLDTLTLGRVAAAGWPAAQTAWLGNWLLRASGGWTRRANSALVTGPPDRPTAAALAACRDWYAARGLPPLLSVPLLPAASGAAASGAAPGTAPLLDLRAVEAAGWRAEVPTVVLVARSADVLAGAEPAVEGRLAVPPTARPSVRLSPAPSAAWLADYRDAATHPAAGAVLAGPPAPARVRFVELADPVVGPGDPGRDPVSPAGVAARGRAVTVNGWVGLTAVGVAPQCRRTGVGRLLVSTLLTDGLRYGGVRSYVEVEQDNSAALAFWERLGYRRSHDWIYYRLVDRLGTEDPTA